MHSFELLQLTLETELAQALLLHFLSGPHLHVLVVHVLERLQLSPTVLYVGWHALVHVPDKH